MTRLLPRSFLAIAVLSIVACGSALLLALDLASVGVAAAASDPNLPPALAPYFSDVATALDCMAAAAQKGGTNAPVGIAIGGCALNAAPPIIPAGTAANTVIIINDAYKAIQQVLAQQAALTAAVNAPGDYIPTGALAFAGSAKPVQKDAKFDAGWRGKAKLAKIRKTLADAKAKLPKKK